MINGKDKNHPKVCAFCASLKQSIPHGEESYFIIHIPTDSADDSHSCLVVCNGHVKCWVNLYVAIYPPLRSICFLKKPSSTRVPVCATSHYPCIHVPYSFSANICRWRLLRKRLRCGNGPGHRSGGMGSESLWCPPWATSMRDTCHWSGKPRSSQMSWWSLFM